MSESESDEGADAGGPCIEQCDGREWVACCLLSYSCLEHPISPSTCIFLLPA